MSFINLNDVVIQELIRSKHATQKYRLAPQRRPIGSIDLSDVENMRQMHKLWKEYVCRKGRFSLLARDRRGRLSKCIAVITVTSNGIEFKDNRCALAVLLRGDDQPKARDSPI
jgi:hypothetical protein